MQEVKESVRRERIPCLRAVHAACIIVVKRNMWCVLEPFINDHCYHLHVNGHERAAESKVLQYVYATCNSTYAVSKT